MEVVKGKVISRDNGTCEHMSVRQETRLPDESADRDNITPADRTYQEKYPWCGNVREDAISAHETLLHKAHTQITNI